MVTPAPNFRSEYEPVIREQMADTAPVVTTEDDEATYRLYELVDGSDTPNGEGLYVRTTHAFGEESATINAYGSPDVSSRTPAAFEYTNNLSGGALDLYQEYSQFVHNAYESLCRSNLFTNSLQETLEELGEEVYLFKRKLFVEASRDDLRSRVENLLRADRSRDTDYALPTDTELESLVDVVMDAVSALLTEGTSNGRLPEGWFGTCYFVDLDDWRPEAEELALYTGLSDQQSVVWAIAQQQFPVRDIAYITGKDKTTVSRQLTQASEKFVDARELIKRTNSGGMGFFQLGGAEQSREGEVAERKWERDKSPVVDYFVCPKCGRDTGSYTGSVLEGSFDDAEPATFLAAVYDHPQGMGDSPRRVECPDCGHTAGSRRFNDAWENHHGQIPRPDSPEPV